MNESLVTQLVEFFKTNYRIELCSAESLMELATNTLEMLMQLGREALAHALAEVSIGSVGHESRRRESSIGSRAIGRRCCTDCLAKCGTNVPTT